MGMCAEHHVMVEWNVWYLASSPLTGMMRRNFRRGLYGVFKSRHCDFVFV